jgi:CheY-like chemotaxis protein
LNNVLAPILLSVQFLRDKLTGGDDQHLLDMLEASAKRGADLIRQILTFARGVEGEKSAVQMRYLVVDIHKMIRDTFPPAVQFQFRIPRDLWPVRGDVTQLSQVLLNLCVNARDAMPNGGRLSIDGDNAILDEQYARMEPEAKAGPYVVLTVTDTGSGIPPAIIDKIFDPFFTTKGPGKGTGLGLATVKQIVAGHGGFVNVYSEAGQGARFKIYLPAIQTSETELRRKQMTSLPAGHGELVLVVDDEASIREISKATLTAYGYEVETANDGTEAVAKYIQRRPDVRVVFTDMQMPFMDGEATIRALRKIDPHVRIIAASGFMANQAALEAGDLVVQGFITKPYTAEKLLEQLHAVLGASVPTDETTTQKAAA